MAPKVVALLFLVLLFVTLARSQPQSPTPPAPAQIETAQPSAHATKNPKKPHHHYDVRHEHPKIQNPVNAPD